MGKDEEEEEEEGEETKERSSRTASGFHVSAGKNTHTDCHICTEQAALAPDG